MIHTYLTPWGAAQDIVNLDGQQHHTTDNIYAQRTTNSNTATLSPPRRRTQAQGLLHTHAPDQGTSRQISREVWIACGSGRIVGVGKKKCARRCVTVNRPPPLRKHNRRAPGNYARVSKHDVCYVLFQTFVNFLCCSLAHTIGLVHMPLELFTKSGW